MSAAGWCGDKVRVLCDCGRVHRLTHDQIIAADWECWAGNYLCECGGDVCPCGYCAGILAGLDAGERDGGALGLQKPGPVVWSEVRGFGK